MYREGQKFEKYGKILLNKFSTLFEYINFLLKNIFDFLQFWELYETFWPLKSLAFICLDYLESEVLQKGPKNITRVLLEIKTTHFAKRLVQLLVWPF